MVKKQFTRTEINEIVGSILIHYYKMYSNEMSLSERLLFTDIFETVKNNLDYKLELLETDVE